jgi:hypothetical protein
MLPFNHSQGLLQYLLGQVGCGQDEVFLQGKNVFASNAHLKGPFFLERLRFSTRLQQQFAILCNSGCEDLQCWPTMPSRLEPDAVPYGGG